MLRILDLRIDGDYAQFKEALEYALIRSSTADEVTLFKKDGRFVVEAR